MKISCQSCQAKYTIADEKVVGKVVKIRCKKCGATIVVNGNEGADAGGAGAGVADYTAGGDDQWTVNVAEGDQRTMTIGEIVQEYKAGVVTDDTYCWKDGMNDWLPLREIEALYQSVTLGPPPQLSTSADGFSPLSLAASPPSAAPSPPASDAGGGFGLFGGASSSSTNGNGEHTDVNGSASLFGGAGSSTAAARRAGGRQTGNADLFGSAAQAGGENDVMTSAAGGAAAAAAGGETKMTGARNENSVLFSLTALTNDNSSPAPTKNETTAQADGSGLIDIRALASSMGVDKDKNAGNAKVDDIMNLSGGGAFSAALAAPVLAPPTADASIYSGSGAPEEGKKKNTMLIGLIGGGAILGVCILAAAMILGGGKKDDKDTKAAPTSTESPTASATAQATPTDTAKPADTGSGTTAAPPSTGEAKTADNGKGTAPAAKTTTKTPSTTPEKTAAVDTPPATPTPAPPSKPRSLQDEMNKATGNDTKPPPAAAPAAGGAPFDRGAALAALSGVAVQSCKKPDGPTGGGKVRVTFEPNGSVSKVEFSEGPFGGTPVGGCILGKFRGARVPAFSGAAVTAAKSFVVN